MGDMSHEPSMEEILSSIKRIIAEDAEAGLSAAPRTKRAVTAPAAPVADATPLPEADVDAPPAGEVLELTETAPEEDDAMAIAESAAPPAPIIAPDAVLKPQTQAQAQPQSEPQIVSPDTVAASRSSIAALSALIVKPEVTGSDTLEGMVRDMLKPMLAEWLDARLPGIVEAAVREEIARITAQS